MEIIKHGNKTFFTADGKNVSDAVNEIIQKTQNEIISQVEEWNNRDGLNTHQIIERLKKLS